MTTTITPGAAFVMSVWGKRHTRQFIQICLPSLLAPDNIPYFRRENIPATFLLFTTSESYAEIARSPVYAELAEACKIAYVNIDHFNLTNPFHAMSLAQTIAFQTQPKNTCFFLHNPDVIYSDHILRGAYARIRSGKRAVLCSDFRVVMESFTVTIEARFGVQPTSISLSSRELVSAGLAHIHDASRSMFWDSPEGPYACWSYAHHTNPQAFVVCNFHMHPLAVLKSQDNVAFSSTCDHDLVMRVSRNFDDVAILEDSDDGYMLEISPFSYNPWDENYHQYQLSWKYVRPCVMWAEAWTNPFHRQVAAVPVYIHGTPPDAPAVIASATAQSLAVAQEINRQLQQSEWEILGDREHVYKRLHGWALVFPEPISFPPERRWQRVLALIILASRDSKYMNFLLRKAGSQVELSHIVIVYYHCLLKPSVCRMILNSRWYAQRPGLFVKNRVVRVAFGLLARLYVGCYWPWLS